MITRDQALTLYELAQVGDNRNPPLPEVMTMWRDISILGDWAYAQGYRAIIEHRNDRPGVYFEPGYISQRVKALREEIRQRWYCPDPPRELGSDPRAEIEWRRQAAEEFVQRNLDRWASGQPLEELRPALESGGGVIQMFSGDSVAKRAALAEVRRFAQSHAVSGKRRGQAS